MEANEIVPANVEIGFPFSPDEGGLLFDWKLDIERLEREARDAMARRQPNDWALVEAECSQDLIEAELKAAQARLDKGEATRRTVEHLVEWSRRIDQVIGQLRSITM
jgi:hypothetical protein